VTDVTISIVSGGRPELLDACLASIPAASGALSVHTVVVDNASLDGLPGAAAHPEVEIRRSELRQGFSANHNLALRGAAGRYLFVLNDDTELHEGCLERLVGLMDQNPAVGCAGPRIVHADGRLQASAFRFPTPARVALTALTLQRAGWVLSGGEHIRRVDWVHGAAMLVRRSAFEELGGLDESFYMYLEDVDLCRRLRDRGWEVVFFPRASLVHFENSSTADVPERRIVQHARSRSLYTRKHHGAAAERAVQALTAGMFAGRIGASKLLRHDATERARFAAHIRASLRPDARPAVEEAAAEHNERAAAV
jgi:N-acetylglucosaminyl-diphospho-decaprenol L-rhamnosyltransferase